MIFVFIMEKPFGEKEEQFLNIFEVSMDGLIMNDNDWLCGDYGHNSG